jgi:hypothetical protein
VDGNWVTCRACESFSPKARKYPSSYLSKFPTPCSLSKHVRRHHFSTSLTFSLLLLPLCFYSGRITDGSQPTCKETLTSRDQKDQTCMHQTALTKKVLYFCSFLWLAFPPAFFSLMYFVRLLPLFQQNWFQFLPPKRDKDQKFTDYKLGLKNPAWKQKTLKSHHCPSLSLL